MLKRTINLRDELVSERRKTRKDFDVLEEVAKILARNEAQREKIRESLSNGGTALPNDFDFDLLDKDNIFHISHIRTVCVNYRLRFLDSSFFKNEIPEEAVTKISHLEKEHNTKL